MPALASAQKKTTSAGAAQDSLTASTAGKDSAARGPATNPDAKSGDSSAANGFGLQLAGLVPEPKEEAAAKAPASEWKGTDSGLKNYQDTLGKWLGSNLYGAVSKELSLAKMSKAATGAWHSALKKVAGSIGDAGELKEGEVEALTKAMTQEFGDIAKDWVEGDGAGLVKKLQGWTDANPIAIATIALLAAAGAVAANVDLPKLKKQIGITNNVTAKLAVSLGQIRDISLEKIEAELKYQSKTVKAAALVQWDEDAGASGRLSMRYEKDDFYGGRLGFDGGVGYSEKDGASADAGVNWSKGNFSMGLRGEANEREKKATFGVKWRF